MALVCYTYKMPQNAKMPHASDASDVNSVTWQNKSERKLSVKYVMADLSLLFTGRANKLTAGAQQV